MLKFRTRVKELLIKSTGYWICKHKHAPVGYDLAFDLKYKVGLPIKTIFDIGANVGQTAVKFNHDFDSSTIYSFEPVTNPFLELKNNTKNLQRIRCFKLALGDKIDSIEIDVYEGGTSVLNSLKKEAQNKNGNVKEIVEVTTGDSFCEEHHILEIDLLKIDTEGYEIEVLEGLQKMLEASKIKALYCEVGFNQDNFRNTYINDIIEFAGKNDFKFFGLYEVSNLQIKEGFNYGNILFIHNTVEVI